MKIINIIPHPPRYDLYHDGSRPEINWDIPDGHWVGIWGYDWSDLIGKELLKLTNEFEYEVWQPDLRADKIYSYEFEEGLVHKLFPAKRLRYLYGLKIIDQFSSEALFENLKKISSNNLILHLNSLGDFISKKIIRKFYLIPKVIQFHSGALIPFNEMKKPRKNILANILYFRSHRALLRNKKVFFIYNNSKNIYLLSQYSHLGKKRIFMGCDFDYWKPGNKEKKKESLGVNSSTKIFSMASRFYPLKQIDKVIKIFTNIERSTKYDFKLFIAGHGENEYEYYLRRISKDLLEKEKIIFTGYLKNEMMRNLLVASDLFISASTHEGGPTSIVKAIACSTPVMCTRVGGVDDILKKYNADILVGNFSYKEWKKKIVGILTGEIKVISMDRNKAKEIFHWPIIAKEFLNVYRKLKDF